MYIYYTIFPWKTYMSRRSYRRSNTNGAHYLHGLPVTYLINSSKGLLYAFVVSLHTADLLSTRAKRGDTYN